MTRKNNKTQFAVGLDAGSSHTRCVICVVEESKLRFLGSGEIESIGWSKSRIADQEAVSTCIRSAVAQAEAQAQISVESLVVGIGGASVRGANNRGVYEFGRPRQISPDDLAYAADRAARVRLESDELLLHVFPQDFNVDGRAGYRNPKGATCSRLEANVHIMTASRQEHDNLLGAVQHSHYAVEDSVFEPVAAAYAAILPGDRIRGVALVDIGLHSTDVVVYDGDAVVAGASLPICGDHFTRDVAFGLKLTYEDADLVKRAYGCAILGLTADNSLIEIPSPEGREPREAPRKLLNDILDARAEQLFEMLRQELAGIGMEQGLLEGVVLTGGGAELNGMCDMAERVLNFETRNGLPQGIEDWPEELSASWTTAAGLAMYSGRIKGKREWKPKVPGLVGLILR